MEAITMPRYLPAHNWMQARRVNEAEDRRAKDQWIVKSFKLSDDFVALSRETGYPLLELLGFRGEEGAIFTDDDFAKLVRQAASLPLRIGIDELARLLRSRK